MALSIASQSPTYDPTYATEEFMVILESHLSNFKSDPKTTVRTFTAQQAEKFQGDFYGLLTDMQVPKNMQYLVLRVNGLTDPADYQGDFLNIMVPSESKLGLLRNISNTTTKKST